MEQTPHFYEQLVRESHVNSFAHMDNLAFLQLFEEARWQMLTERGFGAAEMSRLAMGPVILGIEVQYKKEVFLRQQLTIKTYVTSYSNKIMKLRQEMSSSAHALHSQADYTLGLFDTAARKLIDLTPEWLKACGIG